MRFKKLLSIVLATAMVIPALVVAPKIAKADNPIVQTYYTADPSPMVVGDTLYLITSHDEDILEQNKPTDDYLFYTMKNWKCYSTKDMINWTDHGSIFGQNCFSWGHTWCFRAWAAQCVERNGRFYLYVPILRKGASEEADAPGYGIGVAVADNPYGPYEDAIGAPLIEGDWNDIDPTVFIDDDGQAYLFYGQTLKYCLLNDDMISLKTQPAKFNVPNYVEGPWFTKHNDRYYFMWAANGGATTSAHKGGENIQYAYCDEPLGNYTYGGIMQETTMGNSFTNHPGVCDFKGRSYLFYHTNVLPAGGYNSYHRSVCVSEFTYNDDGTINLVPMPDTIDPIDTYNPYIKSEAETIAWETGVKTGWDTADGEDPTICNGKSVYVYNMHDTDYILLRNVDFGSEGAVSFTASVRDVKQDSDAAINIYADDELVGTAKLDNYSSEWKEITAKLTKTVTGVHDLKFEFVGTYAKPENETGDPYDEKALVSAEDTGMFKFDYWKFDTVSMLATPTPAPTPVVTATTAPTVTPAPTTAPVKVAKVKSITVKKKGNGKVSVSWKKASGAKKYELLYSTDKKFKKSVKKVSIKKTSVMIKKLKRGRYYYFKVRGIDDKVTGKFSPIKKIKV